jgi:hypothetical protein
MWPAPKLEPSTRTSTPLRGGADYLRLPASRSSIVSTGIVRAEGAQIVKAIAEEMPGFRAQGGDAIMEEMLLDDAELGSLGLSHTRLRAR